MEETSSLSEEDSVEIVYEAFKKVSNGIDKERFEAIIAKAIKKLGEEKQSEEIIKFSAYYPSTNTDLQEFRGTFAWDNRIKDLALDKFGFDCFRTGQRECINASLSGKDILVLMPTGSGKSLIFQLVALYEHEKHGSVTIVISPTKALINEQADKLSKMNIQVEKLTSDDNDIASFINNATKNKVPAIIYTTPEKLVQNRLFYESMKKLYDKGLFKSMVIDEAHTVDHWSDFRNAFFGLQNIKRVMPKLKIMKAFTATATNTTQMKILQQLNMSPENTLIFTASLDRPNLIYEVARKPDSKQMTKTVMDWIYLKQLYNSCGIIYVLSRKNTVKYARELNEIKLSFSECKHLVIVAYHAELHYDERMSIQRRWSEGKIHIIVATIAFGLGVDKPDVRYVIHCDMPQSLEHYVQESGRAGRDGKLAHCMLFYCFKDKYKIQHLIENASKRLWDLSRVENINPLIDYCENQHTCRRKMLLEHFHRSETVECLAVCDNCVSNNYNREPIDVGSNMLDIIQIVQEHNPILCTINKIVGVYTGSKNKDLQELEFVKKRGLGKDLSKRVIEWGIKGNAREWWESNGKVGTAADIDKPTNTMTYFYEESYYSQYSGDRSWDVELVLDIKGIREKKYLIKWKNWFPASNSWETSVDSHELIEAFQNRSKPYKKLLEKILKKKTEGGKVFYYVKYIGYPSENNEWISEINNKFVELNEIEETKSLNVKINGLEIVEDLSGDVIVSGKRGVLVSPKIKTPPKSVTKSRSTSPKKVTSKAVKQETTSPALRRLRRNLRSPPVISSDEDFSSDEITPIHNKHQPKRPSPLKYSLNFSSDDSGPRTQESSDNESSDVPIAPKKIKTKKTLVITVSDDDEEEEEISKKKEEIVIKKRKTEHKEEEMEEDMKDSVNRSRDEESEDEIEKEYMKAINGKEEEIVVTKETLLVNKVVENSDKDSEEEESSNEEDNIPLSNLRKQSPIKSPLPKTPSPSNKRPNLTISPKDTPKRIKTSPTTSPTKLTTDMTPSTVITVKVPKFVIRWNYDIVQNMFVLSKSLDQETVVSNRIIRMIGISRLLLVSIQVKMEDWKSKAFQEQLKETIFGGFVYDNKIFSFFFYSSSTLREGSPKIWFVSSDPASPIPDAKSLYFALGNFSEAMKSGIPKLSARVGQALSQTIATIKVPPSQVETIPDYSHNGKIFSDGCGVMTSQTAKEIIDAIATNTCQTYNFIPSVVQFRWGGAKGVLKIQDNFLSPGKKLGIRPSQIKFQSDYETIEICNVSHPTGSASLNRQIIILLSTLGIPTETFKNLVTEYLEELQEATSTSRNLLEFLLRTNSGDFSQKALKMLAAGQNEKDAYFSYLISYMKGSFVSSLVEELKIPVKDSRYLIGVVDDSRALKPNQIYVNLSKYGCLRGRVVITRSPCLHPGDIRVVEAIGECSQLSQLVDCVVFPQYGQRPLPDMMSGGDLDGDMYFVCWDPALIPDDDSLVEPADFSESSGVDSDLKKYVKDVSNKDWNFIQNSLLEWLIEFKTRNELGLICTAHERICDIEKEKALNKDAIFLSFQASRAVDAAKSGLITSMPSELRHYSNKMPHYKELITKLNLKKSSEPKKKEWNKHRKRVDNTYQSKGVVGVLVDFILLHVQNFVKNDDTSYKDSIDDDLIIKTVNEEEEELWEKEVTSANLLLKQFKQDLSNAYKADAIAGKQNKKVYTVLKNVPTVTPITTIISKYEELFKQGVEQSSNEHNVLRALKIKASAWYYVGYKHEYGAFAWLPLEYLNQIKADVNTVRNLSTKSKPSVVINGDIYDQVRLSIRPTKKQ